MAPDATIPCPKCKFRNRPGQPFCLMCKADLNEEAMHKTQEMATPVYGRDFTQRIERHPTMRNAFPRTMATPGLKGDAPPERGALPKPKTSRAVRASNAIAWLRCAPLASIPLVESDVTVGRQENCDLCLPHKEVSRHHATFSVVGTHIVLADKGSSNGTYVNGKRLTEGQPVKVGDIVQIGPYEIDIRATDDQDGSDVSDPSRERTSTRMPGLTTSAAMSGKIEEVSLVEILQQIEFNKKTGTLSVVDGTRKGELVVADGRPVTARWDGIADEAAVRAMLLLRTGHFVLDGTVEAVEATMRTTMTALLLDASRQQDEGGA